MNPVGHPGVHAEPAAADAAAPSSVAAAAAARAVTPDRAWRQLHQTAQARYRDCGRFAWKFAGGKLGWDPVFRHLLEHGHLAPGARVLDIGCGQGLLASLLAAVDSVHAAGAWPVAWPPAPIACQYAGIELMPRDVARAQRALAGLGERVQVVQADMVDAPLTACDAVVILDVLHYVSHADQAALLERVHRHLSPGGRLLLRIGDMMARRGFTASQWADRLITAVRGHRVPPTFCRPLDDWTALLEAIGFTPVRSLPMSRGTPFANVLLVADKP